MGEAALEGGAHPEVDLGVRAAHRLLSEKRQRLQRSSQDCSIKTSQSS